MFAELDIETLNNSVYEIEFSNLDQLNFMVGV